MRALLREARIVDDPVRYRLPSRHRRQRVARGLAAHVTVGPFRAPSEVRQPLVGGIDTLRVGTCARRHRLHAFPLSVAHQPQGVSGKRRSLRRRSQDFPNPVEVRGQPSFSLTIQQVFHPHYVADFPPD